MENNFANAPQGYGVEPKKKSGGAVWIIVILLVIAGAWYLFMNKSKTNDSMMTDTNQSLDQQVDTSIDSVLSDLQSEDATADASSADFSDLYQLDINQ